ncbi:MAG: DUF3108 domain-containing protein [Ectothiorhodospiraceae bacterium]|nr:DUF3108 domain-containing protein [Chromatiales bacterium]MCP5156996.1 DUF3108 domain-containing protein [Ectothiorhodospiraceae bacterium]
MIARLVLALTALVAGVCAAAAPIWTEQGFEARYVVIAAGLAMGRSEVTLTANGDGTVVYQSDTRPTGIAALFDGARRVERSELRWLDGRPAPMRYRFERIGGRRDRREHVEFDRALGTARGQDRSGTWQVQFPAAAQDRLSVQLGLMRDLGRPGADLDYQVVDGGRLKGYRFERIGTDRTRSPYGKLDTVVVRRVRDDDTRETTMWCAPSLDFLPVRIEHRERDGQVIVMELESVTGIELAAKTTR